MNYNYYEIISVFYFTYSITTSETDTKLFRPLNSVVILLENNLLLFQGHLTCWKIFMSCNEPPK